MRAEVLSAAWPASVDTPEFRAWFGRSAVVDVDGRPLPVYHGTAIEKDRFRREGGAAGMGAYFTADRKAAQAYAENDAEVDGEDPIVMEVYLSIKNPYVTVFEFDPDNYDPDADPQAISATFRDRLEALGHDGVHVTNTGEWVAFRPEQIKLANGNIGRFDPQDPRIAFKRVVEQSERDEDDEDRACAPRF